ncbi:MAG: pitrilysin family protein [Bacteroidetes bacterium]|nr:pitrilysin family protein [Bacteroidota bacterium]
MIQSIDRAKAPAQEEFDHIKIQEVEKSALDNGIPVYSIRAGFQDVVKVEMLFMNRGFDASQPLVFSATNRMMSEGSKHHNAQELAEMIDGYGSFYETEESSDYCSLNLFTLNKHLESTLPVFREILMEPEFPENELSVFRQNNRQRLIVEGERVNAVARRKFHEVIFGASHPYGYFVKPVDYEKLQREPLMSYHRKNYSSTNCSIIVSGNVTAEVISLLNKFFGSGEWKGTQQKETVTDISSHLDKKHVVEKKGAVQSAIRIGKVLFNKTHPDYIGMTILNTALGGYFGSRLMNNIREDKGYTYGIGSAMVSMKEGGCFFISTEVGAEVTSKAVKEIYKEVELLRKKPLEGNELLMVKNFLTGSFLKGIDGAFHLADRWKGLMLYGLGYDYYYRYLETVRTIKAEELMILAQKYLDPGDFYEIIVGKK